MTLTELLQGAVKAARSMLMPETPSSEGRLRICVACPHLVRRNMRCGKCGCPVVRKVKLPAEHCPVGRW